MKIQSPCLNCSKRAIPKTCEKNCAKWKAYRNEATKYKKIIELNKYGGLRNGY